MNGFVINFDRKGLGPQSGSFADGAGSVTHVTDKAVQDTFAGRFFINTFEIGDDSFKVLCAKEQGIGSFFG